MVFYILVGLGALATSILAILAAYENLKEESCDDVYKWSSWPLIGADFVYWLAVYIYGIIIVK